MVEPEPSSLRRRPSSRCRRRCRPRPARPTSTAATRPPGALAAGRAGPAALGGRAPGRRGPPGPSADAGARERPVRPYGVPARAGARAAAPGAAPAEAGGRARSAGRPGAGRRGAPAAARCGHRRRARPTGRRAAGAGGADCAVGGAAQERRAGTAVRTEPAVGRHRRGGSALVLGAHSSLLVSYTPSHAGDGSTYSVLLRTAFPIGRQTHVSRDLSSGPDPLRPANRTHPQRGPPAAVPPRWHDNPVTITPPGRLPSRPPAISVIAHRGASEDAPEHTLAAYRKAIEDGRGRPGVRRPAHRRRAARLRARPQGQPHLQRPRRRLRPGTGRSRRPRLRLLEGGPDEESARLGRPGARRAHLRAHPGAAAANWSPTPTAPRRAGHRDQAPHPLGRPGGGAAARAARAVRPGRAAGRRARPACAS